MKNKFSTVQTQQQRLNLSAAQIQGLKMLTMQSTELRQIIEREVEDNPALEKIDEDGGDRTDTTIDDYIKREDQPYSAQIHGSSWSGDNSRQDFLLGKLTDGGQTLADNLKEQLVYLPLTEKEKSIALFLIGTLDEEGYLRKYNQNISDDLIFTQGIDANNDEIEKVIRMIQTLEPAGVAARNIQECLLIQLKRDDDKSSSVLNAIVLLEKYYDALVGKRYEAIMAKTGMSRDELRDAIAEITSLNPKPSNGFANEGEGNTQAVTPDFLVEYDKENDDFKITISGEDAVKLRISRSYTQIAKDLKLQTDTESKKGLDFISGKIKAAEWFIASVKQRQDTLRKTMKAIIEYQRAFFIDGNTENLRPMVLKDIADVTGLDVSTIWRVVDSKYVQTSFGIFYLKNFFTGGYTTSDGTEVTSGNIKNILRTNIASEDSTNPLTDQQLMEVLKENGYDIARRTIAKYREQLGIPVARLRRKV